MTCPVFMPYFQKLKKRTHNVKFLFGIFICEIPLHWARGRTFHLHSICARFESRLQHRLQSWRVLCFKSDPLGSLRHSVSQTLRPLVRQFLLIHRTRPSSYFIRCQITTKNDRVSSNNVSFFEPNLRHEYLCHLVWGFVTKVTGPI
jgi:hypothetical protein